MKKLTFLLSCLLTILSLTCFAHQIDYKNCESIEQIIARETQEIANTSHSDHDELAQLYVSRGESYLIHEEYEKALQDFLNANFHIGLTRNTRTAIFIAFRAALGEVICYDNLGLQENVHLTIQQLEFITDHINCPKCFHKKLLKSNSHSIHFQELITLCKYKKYAEDDQPSEENQQEKHTDRFNPNDSWCEETVIGVGRAMDVIAALAPSLSVKIALIGAIEALISRGVKCCQAGGLWKVCVEPIYRKWQEWNKNKERNILPNNHNLPFYIN